MLNDENNAERGNNTLDSLPQVALRDGTRAVVLIEPRPPYLVVVRGGRESSSTRPAPTTEESRNHDESGKAKSPTTGKLRHITAEKLRARRTTD